MNPRLLILMESPINMLIRMPDEIVPHICKYLTISNIVYLPYICKSLQERLLKFNISVIGKHREIIDSGMVNTILHMNRWECLNYEFIRSISYEHANSVSLIPVFYKYVDSCTIMKMPGIDSDDYIYIINNMAKYWISMGYCGIKNPYTALIFNTRAYMKISDFIKEWVRWRNGNCGVLVENAKMTARLRDLNAYPLSPSTIAMLTNG